MSDIPSFFFCKTSHRHNLQFKGAPVMGRNHFIDSFPRNKYGFGLFHHFILLPFFFFCKEYGLSRAQWDSFFFLLFPLSLVCFIISASKADAYYY